MSTVMKNKKNFILEIEFIGLEEAVFNQRSKVEHKILTQLKIFLLINVLIYLIIIY